MTTNNKGFIPHLLFIQYAKKLLFQKHMNTKKGAGFTLLEVMVTLAIFSIIASAMFLVLSSGRNTWLSGTTYIEVQQELRKAKEWITEELSQGGCSTLEMLNFTYDAINDIKHSNKIRFAIPLSVTDGGEVHWQDDPKIEYYVDELNNRQLIRKVGESEKIIANNIDSIDFAQNQKEPQLIYITITASKQDIKGRTISSVLNFKIKFRN